MILGDLTIHLDNPPDSADETRKRAQEHAEDSTTNGHNQAPANSSSHSSERTEPGTKSLPKVNSVQPAIGRENTFECYCCHGVFESETLCRQHIEKVCGRRFECEICASRFTHRCYLKTHHSLSHAKKRPFACKVDDCGKRFVAKGQLQRHKLMHTGEKPFVCEKEECGRKFTQKAHLMDHMRIHTGERPFVCNTCGKQFAQSGHLNEHKRIHTGEKPFVCPECGKRFARPSHVTSHRRVHTGERPFACSYPGCGKMFSSCSNFRAHEQIHFKKNCSFKIQWD